MERRVAPELLDELAAADPRAVRARRDLQRMNALMGHAAIMTRTLRSLCGPSRPQRLVELGAGDGTFLLRVARLLGAAWRGTSVLLLDRLSLVARETRRGFEACGWRVEAVEAEASAWLERSDAHGCDAMLANLFLHHFTAGQLRAMLTTAARQTKTFIALEPRRSGTGLFCSRLLWAVGCSFVTRYDARVSVRAGFAGRELSQVWPALAGWRLEEHPLGSFSHRFVAQRKE